MSAEQDTIARAKPERYCWEGAQSGQIIFYPELVQRYGQREGCTEAVSGTDALKSMGLPTIGSCNGRRA